MPGTPLVDATDPRWADWRESQAAWQARHEGYLFTCAVVAADVAQQQIVLDAQAAGLAVLAEHPAPTERGDTNHVSNPDGRLL